MGIDSEHLEEKEPKKVVILRITAWIFSLLIPLLFFHMMWDGNTVQFHQRFIYPTSRSTETNLNSLENQTNPNSLDFLLSKLVQEKHLQSFRATGFSCDSQLHSKHCVTSRATRLDTTTMTLTIPSNDPMQELELRPYARQEDKDLLEKVTPVKILLGRGNTSTVSPPCEYSHRVPAVVFSSSGFIGNAFHEMDEIIIPLFITTYLFNSSVVLVMEDYRPSFVKKYEKIFSHLSAYEVLNPAANRSVHCFPAAVVGLKFHGYLSLNSSDVPRGLTTHIFRQFLRRSFDLKYSHVSQINAPPTAMLLSRTTTRRIINQDEVVAMMEELGFRVIVVTRAQVMSNLTMISSMINSCSVFVGVHGAGLTNGLFLPDGAVIVQVDLIALEWAAATYFGIPSRSMGVRYLRYKIEPEESSLLKIFGSTSHKAFTDPKGAFTVDAGREVYLNGQNVNINVVRFRHTMAMAMSLVRDL